MSQRCRRVTSRSRLASPRSVSVRRGATEVLAKTSVMRSPLALAKPSLYDPVSIV
ncbi:hypothetical protein [Nostoc sp.]|uniref:hypothetical protein n=1 Tax=Nostoc sp. TaxID=1180 RepID=UPI002FF5E8FB